MQMLTLNPNKRITASQVLQYSIQSVLNYRHCATNISLQLETYLKCLSAFM